MQQTDENLSTVREMVLEYDILPHKYSNDGILAKARKALEQTYLDAFKSIDSARVVHRDILRGERFYPVPAVIRHYLRERNFVEVDLLREDEERDAARIAAEAADLKATD